MPSWARSERSWHPKACHVTSNQRQLLRAALGSLRPAAVRCRGDLPARGGGSYVSGRSRGAVVRHQERATHPQEGSYADSEVDCGLAGGMWRRSTAAS